jgi:3-methyladenine DNA glycosylase AlkC
LLLHIKGSDSFDMTSEAGGPALLKDILGPQALMVIANAGEASSPRFDRTAFLNAAIADLTSLSIMERVRHIADAIAKAVPHDYLAGVEIVRAMAPCLSHGFQAMALTDYVGRYGLNNFEASMSALADLTRFGTAEFAIRPFLLHDFDRTLAVMLGWSNSVDEHVRRLASEGSRPRLPWAARVPGLNGDPTRTAPILEALMTDPSAYVRKSVANHLNDIAKDQPDWLLSRLENWPQENPGTKWIVRHGLRTLIKQGEPRALALIGVGHGAAVDVMQFSVAPQSICLGKDITISARLLSTATKSQRLVVDYRVHYVRAAGRTAAKVFKLRTFDFPAGETINLAIRQRIQDFSTRRHYSGGHAIELIVNGQTRAWSEFTLLEGD